MTEPNADVKLCGCGCGKPTRIAKYTDPRHGHVKGQPVRFIKGHSHRGKVVSAETRAKLSAAGRGGGNGGWMGDDASYRALHGYLCQHYPKTGFCEECGHAAERTEYALIHGRAYSRNRDDYRELCRPCHMHYDLGGRSKLGAAVEDEVRQKVAQGQTHRALAAEYGVSKSLITKIARNAWTRRHHPDGPLSAAAVGEHHHRALRLHRATAAAAPGESAERLYDQERDGGT